MRPARRATANPLRAAILSPRMNGWMKLGLVALVVVAAVELAAKSPATTAPRGTPAPAFSLRDTEGRQVSLASLRGKVVAVNFWASWCAPCLAEIPEFAHVYQAKRGPCFEMLGLAEESGTRDEVVATAKKLGINYPVLLDDDGKVSDDFKIDAYPRTFLIDARGDVRKVFEGEVDRAALERELAPLLAEAAPACRKA
jgi:cytochrome c biogenesis protein CcmG, thiol:disulfide interchange protein DsbE